MRLDIPVRENTVTNCIETKWISCSVCLLAVFGSWYNFFSKNELPCLTSFITEITLGLFLIQIKPIAQQSYNPSKQRRRKKGGQTMVKKGHILETGSKNMPKQTVCLRDAEKKIQRSFSTSLGASIAARGPHLIRALIAPLRNWIDDISISPWLAHLWAQDTLKLSTVIQLECLSDEPREDTGCLLNCHLLLIQITFMPGWKFNQLNNWSADLISNSKCKSKENSS